MDSNWLSPRGLKHRGSSSPHGSTTPKRPHSPALVPRDGEQDEVSIRSQHHTPQLPSSSSHQASDPLSLTHGISPAPRPPPPPQLQPSAQHRSGSPHAITQQPPTINAPTSSTRAPLPPSSGFPIGSTSGGGAPAPETRKRSQTDILPVVWDSVKLISRVGAASAEAFAPAKAAVVGVKEILTIWKVSHLWVATRLIQDYNKEISGRTRRRIGPM